MEFFYKDAQGNLAAAGIDQINDKQCTLYDKDGNVLRAAEAPAVQTSGTGGSIEEKLARTIEELGIAAKGMQQFVEGRDQAVDEMKQKLAAYEDAAKRGLIIPFNVPGQGTEPNKYTAEQRQIFYGGRDLAIQGRNLMRKFAGQPGKHQLTEEKRELLGDYFLLFLRANAGDIRAADEFYRKYGVGKTAAVGAGGNVFPIPDIVDSEILAFAREQSVILRDARVWPMSSDKQSFPSETARASASWGRTTNESEPTVTEVELDTQILSAYSSVYNETLEDANSDIVSWLTEALSESVALALDTEAFSGDNTNCCYGILHASGAGYSVVLSGSISTVTFTDLSNMIAKIDGLKKIGAKFYMNGNIFHFIRSMKDSNNAPIFIPNIGVADMPGNILGYPYQEVTVMPSTSAASTGYIAFGNLRYFAVGQRIGTGALMVDPYGLWTTNITRFKIYRRWAMKVGLRNGLCRLVSGA